MSEIRSATRIAGPCATAAPADTSGTVPRSSILEFISTPFDKAIEFLKKLGPARGTNLAIFGDHNRAYFHWHEAAAEGDLRPGAILVHFDAHSDIGTFASQPPPPGASLAEQDAFTMKLDIGQFITPAILDGTVDEIYWVLPSWAPRSSHKADSFWKSSEKLRNRKRLTYEHRETMAALFGPERTTSFDIVPLKNDPASFYTIPADRNERPGDTVRRFTVHKIYLDELPDLSREGRDVILDIDLDWLGNTGFASLDYVQSSGLLSDELLRVSELTGRLIQRNVTPAVVTIALSPEYSYSENSDDTLKGLVESLVNSGIMAAVEPVIGDMSVSTNISTFAEKVMMLTVFNMWWDPRIYADMASLNAPQWLFDNFLNGQIELDLPGPLDESREFDSKTSVSRSQGMTTHLTYARNDYSEIINECDAYGLTLLCSGIEALEASRMDLEIDPGSLRTYYMRVMDLAKPLLQNGRTYRYTYNITIHADLEPIGK